MDIDDVLVMTYGTLMSDGYNHFYMQEAGGEFVDEVVSCESKFKLIDVSSFPGLVAGDGKFYGELYSVPSYGVLTTLDELEGYPTMYDRGYIEVQSINNGKKYKALVYYLTKSMIQSLDSRNNMNSFITCENGIYRYDYVKETYK